LDFQKVTLGLWGFSKFEFSSTRSLRYIGGGFGLGGVEAASDEKIPFGSWNTKIGCSFNLGWFNSNFGLKTDKVLF